MSFSSYKHMTNPVVRGLNEADRACEADPRHYTRDESLAILKNRYSPSQQPLAEHPDFDTPNPHIG